VLNYENELKKLYFEKEQILEKIDKEENRVLNPRKIDFEELKNAFHLRKE
jgi:hypothetical protein